MKHLQESKSLAVSQILWALVESFLQCVQSKLCCEIAEVAWLSGHSLRPLLNLHSNLDITRNASYFWTIKVCLIPYHDLYTSIPPLHTLVVLFIFHEPNPTWASPANFPPPRQCLP
jgi:hypothetical protein